MHLLFITPLEQASARAALGPSAPPSVTVLAATEAVARIAAVPADAIIADLRTANIEVSALLSAVRQAHPTAVVVALAPSGAPERALEALRNGADETVEGDVIDEEAALARIFLLSAQTTAVRALIREGRQACLERDLAQQELARVTRLAVASHRAGAALSLVRGVCHDINNPLTGILGYAQLLQESMSGTALEDIKEIEGCAQRCRDLVGRLARFCRVDRAAPVAVEVGPIVDDVLAFTEYLTKRNRIRVSVSLDAHLPGIVVDVSALRHAVLALVLNAIEAMLTTGDRLLEVTTRTSGSVIEIVVADSGPGVAQEDCARIFEAFYTTRASSENAGLGLVAGRAFAQAHGGDVRVEGTASGGAAFILSLPIPPCPASPP
ncbi:MAG: hypothetical protein EB084_00745 [Proteobacteria bacterium]|nr:hypothetical protein [Pseudomonadota bacterium]